MELKYPASNLIMLYTVHTCISTLLQIEYLLYIFCCRLLVLALLTGADPDGDAEPGPPANYLFYEHERNNPLTLLLRAHIYHHQPTQVIISQIHPSERKHPLILLLRAHIYHHQPTQVIISHPLPPPPISPPPSPEQKHPLTLLLRAHIYHHQPTQVIISHPLPPLPISPPPPPRPSKNTLSHYC